MTTVEIGSGLTAAHGSGYRSRIQKMMGFIAKGKTGKSPVQHKFFTSTVTMVSSTTTLSPGSDCCFVLDITNSDLYFVSAWTDTDAFTVTKIVD